MDEIISSFVIVTEMFIYFDLMEESTSWDSSKSHDGTDWLIDKTSIRFVSPEFL